MPSCFGRSSSVRTRANIQSDARAPAIAPRYGAVEVAARDRRVPERGRTIVDACGAGIGGHAVGVGLARGVRGAPGLREKAAYLFAELLVPAAVLEVHARPPVLF